MNARTIGLFAAALFLGCAPAGPTPAPAQPPPAASSGPVGSPFSDRRMGLTAPLLLDRTDLRIGTTVHFSRVPSLGELHDLQSVPSLAHVVLTLAEWPAEFAALQGLDRLPPEADLIVLLPGYPPSRAAAEAWNLAQTRVRLVVVAQGPPPSTAVIGDLNTMRGLERVIVEMDDPSRSGFERLQRPLSFRKFIE